MERENERSLDIQDILIDLPKLRKSRQSYVQTLKQNASTLLQKPYVRDPIKLMLGAMAWQATYNAEGVAYSEDKAKYVLCCFLTGLADSAVSFGIDTLLTIYNRNSTHCVSTFKQMSINLLWYALISGLWQPAVDIGYALGALISKVGGEVGGGFAVFVMNASLFRLMRYIDPEVPSVLVAATAETSFYISGPLALPGSPAGSRTCGYAGGFTLTGAIFAILLKETMRHTANFFRTCNVNKTNAHEAKMEKHAYNSQNIFTVNTISCRPPLWRSCCASQDDDTITTPLLAQTSHSNKFSCVLL